MRDNINLRIINVVLFLATYSAEKYDVSYQAQNSVFKLPIRQLSVNVNAIIFTTHFINCLHGRKYHKYQHLNLLTPLNYLHGSERSH